MTHFADGKYMTLKQEILYRQSRPPGPSNIVIDTVDPEISETIHTYEFNMEAYILRWSQMIPQIESLIRQFMKILPGNQVVDVGCGVARDTKFYRDQGYNVVAIDLSEKILKEANKRVSGAEFCRMDLRYLGFKDEAYDGVHCWASLQHIPKRYLDKVITDFNRILRPKGGLLIHTRYGRGETFIPEQGCHRRFFALYTEDELLSIIKRHGFDPYNCLIVRKVRFEPEVMMLNLVAKKA